MKQQTNYQSEGIIIERRKHDRLRRAIAMLSAVVMFFTMNSLKMNADTLERVPTCGIEAHVHSDECYGEDDELICDLEAHEHTDACYQQRPEKVEPAATAIDSFIPLNAGVQLTSDGVVVTGQVYEEQELELGENGIAGTDDEATDLPGEEDEEPFVEVPAVVELPESGYRYDFHGAGSALLSQILYAVRLPLAIEDIEEVSQVQEGEDEAFLLRIEEIEDDYSIAAVKTFDAVEIAVFTAGHIYTIDLVNAAVEAAADADADEAAEDADAANSADDEEDIPAQAEADDNIIEETDAEETVTEETAGEGETEETEETEAAEESEETEETEETEATEETEETEATEEDETTEETEAAEEDETTEESEAAEETEAVEEGATVETFGNVTIEAVEGTLPGTLKVDCVEGDTGVVDELKRMLAQRPMSRSMKNAGRLMMSAAPAAQTSGTTEPGYAVFDIKVDADGAELPEVRITVRPETPVDLYANVPEGAVVVGEPRFKLYHIHDGALMPTPEDVAVEYDDGMLTSLSFTTSSCSPFILEYTVDFHYSDTDVSIEGGSQVLLSTLIAQLNITDAEGNLIDVNDVASVSFTDERLVTVEEVSGEVEVNGETVTIEGKDFLLTSNEPFTSAEQLVITLIDAEAEPVVVDVTDEMQTTSPWDLAIRDNTEFLKVSVDSSVTETELERDASFQLKILYSLKEDVVHAIDNYEGYPVLEYDLAPFAAQFPVEIQDVSNGVISIGTRKLGNYVIRNGKVTITFTDTSYFDGMADYIGYFTVTVLTHESEVNDDGEYEFRFPGTSDTIPINYKDSVEKGSKTVNAVKNNDGSYTLHYTANVNVNSDLDSMTFYDTLGGLQTLDPSSVKIGGRSVTVTQDDQNNFHFDVATALSTTGVAKGSYQVTYDTKVTEAQLKAMNSDQTTETNKVTWRVNGKRDVDGGDTTVTLNKPQEPIPVEKNMNAGATSTPGQTIEYTVTYGNDKTELSGFHISDSMTDVVIPQGQVTITYNGGQHTEVDFKDNIKDNSYSKYNMETVFDYTFPNGTPGYGPVTVTYSVKLLDAATAKENGVYDQTDVSNIAKEHRQNTTDNEKTTVPYEKEPNYTVKKVAAGTYEPGSYINYTLTIGDESTNMAGVNIKDVMTDLQVLEGDIWIQVGNESPRKLSEYVDGAIKYTNDRQYSTDDVVLFDFNMPSNAGNGPVVITYTTKVIDETTAHNANIYEDTNIKNTGYGGKQSDETSGHVDFGDYPIKKTVTQNGTDVNGETLEMGETVHYTLTLGDAGMDLGNAVIEDWMTDLQKLVSAITIKRADGTVFEEMPVASPDPNLEDGCRWVYLNDRQYSTNEICLFKYKLPANIGRGPITIEYDCKIIDEDEANNSGIKDTKDVKNRFTHNQHKAETKVTIKFPTDPKHNPQIRKEFDHWDVPNQKLYWNIIVEKEAESAYPLENVSVKESIANGSVRIRSPKQEVWDMEINSGDFFDVVNAVVTTDNGTVLTPGEDYTIDKTTTEFIFPVLNERVHINLAFKSPYKIIDQFHMDNTVVLNDQKSAQADATYDNPEIDLVKSGTYSENDRIVKWQVLINPSQKPYQDSDPIRVWFTDKIPEGLTLVGSTINVAYATKGTSKDYTVTVDPETNVIGTVDPETNEFGPIDIAGHGIYGNQEVGLNNERFTVTYYTKLSDEEWDRITSSASGSETFENHVEITAGNNEHMDATDKVTVTSEGYITKTDSTKQLPNGLVVDVNDEASKEITYTIEINPHGYMLNNGSTLKLTDSIATNMDLNPESVKVVFGTMGPDGKLVPGTETPDGLQISYNDDARILIIDKIPDKTPLVLTYGCYARAQGEDTFTNTATLIGGGSHSASDTKKHTIQTSEAGVQVDGIQFNMLKIDENNISEKLKGAKFQLYKCNLAIGNLSADDGSNTHDQAWWNNLLEMMNRINAGNGTAGEIQYVRDNFKIVSTEQVGEPVTTGITGFTQFKGLSEHVLYAWKEVQAPDGYTANGDFHYFVGYQHLDVNSDEIPQPLLGPTEQLNRKNAAWALDDACQLANGIRVASMANLVTWTATNVESQYTSISATKVWEDDSDNLFETRPTGGIKLQLWQIDEDGNKTEWGDPVAINVTDNGKWPTYIWNMLPVNYGGTKTYKYTVTEERVDGYTTSYSDNGEGQTSGEIIVTNKMIPKNTEIHVKKVFDQAENEPKPESITVMLAVIMTNKKTGVAQPPEIVYSEERELNDGNNWSASWSKLPTTKLMPNADGTKTAYDLTYTVVEDIPKLERDGFGDYIVTYSNTEGVVKTTEDDPLVITNTKPSKGGLRIKKIVAENGNSDSESMSNAAKTALAGTYTFKIYTDAACSTPYQVEGEDVTVSVTIDADGKAVTSDEVTGMPAGDYWIKENALSNKAIVPQDPVKVTVQAGKTGEAAVIAEFTNNYETIKAKVHKEWVNDTPSNFNLEVKLYAHNATDENSVGTPKATVTLNAGNNWTSDVINGLPVLDDQGNAITYHWVEGSMPSGYFLTSTSTSPVDGVVTTTLTNTKQNYDLKTSYVGKKTWEDSNNVWKTRPSTSQFVVELYQIKKVNGSYPENGTKMEGVEPTTWNQVDNEWTYTFENLPVFDENGEVIKYYAQEIVPEGYKQKDGTGIPVDTTYNFGTATVKRRNDCSEPYGMKLNSLLDLGFLVIRTTDHKFIVWTHRVPTPYELSKIEELASREWSDYWNANRIHEYATGLPFTDQTSHGSATVSEKTVEGGRGLWLAFTSPSVWTHYIFGQFEQSQYDIGTTEFTNTLEKTSLEGTKIWKIGGKPVNNATDVTLKLTRKSRKAGATEETIYVKTENGKTEYVTSGDVLLQPTWTGDSFKYENLPAKDPEGNLYDYAVTEASFKVGTNKYTVSADGTVTSDPANAPKMKMTQTGNDITNTELTAVEVTKTWKLGNDALTDDQIAQIAEYEITYKVQQSEDGQNWTDYGNGATHTMTWIAAAEGGDPTIENNKVDGLPAGKQYRAVETGAKIKLKGMSEFITISVDDPATTEVETVKTGTNSGNGPFATAFENVIPKTKIKVVKVWSYNGAPATPDLPPEEQSPIPTVKVTLHRGTEDMGVREIERKEKADGTYEWVLEIDNLDRYYWDSTNNRFSEYEYYFTENEGSDMNGWTLATYTGDDNVPQYSGSAATTKGGTITITNSKSTYTLPETGGAGTTLIHVIGAGLLILAAIWFILDQKKRFDRY